LNHQGQDHAEDYRGNHDGADFDDWMQKSRNYMDDDDLLQVAADDVAQPQDQNRSCPEFRLLPELSHRDPSAKPIPESLDCRPANVNVERDAD
jgi:hypothetical protein